MTLRDFGAPSEERVVILNHEPIGNGSGLGNFHTVNPEDREPNNTGKIVGALAVALMVGAGGLYAYTASGKRVQPVQEVAQLPSPPPAQPAAMTPPPAPEAMAPETAPAMAPAPAMTPAPAPATRTARVATPAPAMSDGASVRMNADAQAVNPQPAQQAAVIPEPVSPTPSPSDVAIANPTVAPEQSAVPAPEAPAVVPQPQAAAPAQAQPEQAAGQVNQ